jgi:hypothetical protein
MEVRPVMWCADLREHTNDDSEEAPDLRHRRTIRREYEFELG